MLLERVGEFLRREGLQPRGDRMVIGVSGGLDSTTLLDVLVRIGVKPIAVHVNYGLRGSDSDADEALVREMCHRLDIELDVLHADREVLVGQSGRSLQESAREFRYEAYEESASSRSVRWVATAHHRDDQAETILLNLIRGTGPDGFVGMPSTRAIRPGSTISVMRPLLSSGRGEINAYAEARNLLWRRDASNADNRFRRSVIRNEVLPVLTEHYGYAAVDGILRSAALVASAGSSRAAPTLNDVVEVKGGTVELPFGAFEDLAIPARGQLILGILRRWFPAAPQSKVIVDAIGSLVDLQAGRRWEHPSLSVIRERDGLAFVPGGTSEDSLPEAAEKIEPGTSVQVPGAVVRADILAVRPKVLDAGSPLVAFVDAGRVAGGLLVDRWRPGDTIRMLGSDGSKKVSDLLTEEKLAHRHRRSVRVVRCEDNVVWVVGVRQSADYVVRAGTSKVLMLSALPVGSGMYFRS